MDSFFKSKRNVVLTAIFYTFLWGCAFPLVKICMEAFQIPGNDNMSKCLVAGIRFSFSGALALLWCFFKEKTKISINSQQVKSILLYGILGTALQYSFTYIGLSRIDGSKGAVYDQLCVFIVVLTSGIFFKNDKLNFNKIIGAVLGFTGVLVVNTDGVSFSFNLLITVFGVVMSSVMLGENIFKWNYAASLILISIGIILINAKKRKG